MSGDHSHDPHEHVHRTGGPLRIGIGGRVEHVLHVLGKELPQPAMRSHAADQGIHHRTGRAGDVQRLCSANPQGGPLMSNRRLITLLLFILLLGAYYYLNSQQNAPAQVCRIVDRL